MSTTLSGSGWTAEKVRVLLQERRAKVEPFNSAYMKIYLKRPELPLPKDPLNRFFAEGAPEYNAPGLVPRAIVEAALQA